MKKEDRAKIKSRKIAEHQQEIKYDLFTYGPEQVFHRLLLGLSKHILCTGREKEKYNTKLTHISLTLFGGGEICD